MATIGVKVEFGWIDMSGERTRTQLHVGADPAADVLNAVVTKANLLRVALETMTLCNETKVGATIPVHSAAATLPTDTGANRESGLRVFYSDTVTGKQYHADIPGVDQTVLRQVGTDVPINTVGLNAFTTAFNASVVSEFGNPCAVSGYRLYGKNN